MPYILVQPWHTSVVISARSGPAPVLSALGTLSRLPQFAELEVVVANCCGPAAERAIAGVFPGVRVITLPASISIAESRDAAIRRTSGDLVAVLHERYHVTPDWLARIWQAHSAQSAEVVAGCVGPSPRLSIAQWAMFLIEYMHAAPPLTSGLLDRAAACMIPGGNVSYKRTAFQEASMAGHLWELDFHAALFDRGVRFYRDGNLIARFAHPYTVREYVRERVRVSRELAGRRAAGMPLVSRLAMAVLRLALPALVIARATRSVLRKKAYAGRLLLALPWMAAFSMVQAWGEMTGSLAAAGCRDGQSVSHQSAPGPER